jgi:casein kinase II subunit beta
METVQQARELYGLLHSRYIMTSRGLAMIREKFLNGVYGHCPRILCNKQNLLPLGLSEELKYSRVKVNFIFFK